METVKHYARIQEYRYPGKFELKIQVPEFLKCALIPKTVLQPLVENALLHSIFPTGRCGVIQIKAELLADQTLQIEVSDNGMGTDQESLELAIEQRRQKNDSARHWTEQYCRKDPVYVWKFLRMRFHSVCGKGTEISITLPYQKSETKLQRWALYR